jgi:hypothetical protein
MKEVAGPVSSTGGETLPAPPQRDGSASRARGCLRIVGRLGLILAGLTVLAFVALYITLEQTFKAPQPVLAPVAWTSRDVVLSPDRPIVHGRLTLTAREAPKTDLRVGVNAGVPSTEAVSSPSGSAATSPSVDAGPAALLAGPSVRLTAATAAGTPRSCLAPCELQLPSEFECGSGTCRIDFDVTVELMSDSLGIGGSVTLGVAGGATAPLDERLPDRLVIDLALDGAIVPAGS